MTVDEALAFADRDQYSADPVFAALAAEVERLRALLRQTVAEHDNGHSPCNCVELAVALGIEFRGDE